MEITLTSPGGMISKLAEVHGDTGADFSNWTFSTVRSWGEISTGTWTLKIADLSSTGNTTGGTLTAAELKIFGSPANPVITAASLSASGQSYSDVPLTVTSSTASDGVSSSAAFTTASVNLLTRPVTLAEMGSAYSYPSGLVLRSADTSLTRRAIIHEFSQGPVGSSSEWIEILTLQAGSLASWNLHESSANTLTFLNAPVWNNIPAGTLIVIYNGNSKDPLLPADDLDPADGRMIISSTDPAYFAPSSAAWLPLGNNGDSIFLADPTGAIVHSFAYGNSTAATPNIGGIGSASSAHFKGDTDAAANFASNWQITTAAAATPATAYPIVIERYNSLGEVVSQSYTLTLIPAATDLTASYEWSADLVTWHPPSAVVTITAAPVNDLIEVITTVTASPVPQLFVRLKVVR